ncbi:unnamed protein product [Brachionus calyciflorus]|uniref:Uncharacterized protein n=1 Tax=Brachionus calyciflorus TaxID=104777 RepID=A0A814AP83_9BILA|nr:unnamed protein product [Brachionus calyciflorus]
MAKYYSVKQDIFATKAVPNSKNKYLVNILLKHKKSVDWISCVLKLALKLGDENLISLGESALKLALKANIKIPPEILSEWKLEEEPVKKPKDEVQPDEEKFDDALEPEITDPNFIDILKALTKSLNINKSLRIETLKSPSQNVKGNDSVDSIASLKIPVNKKLNCLEKEIINSSSKFSTSCTFEINNKNKDCLIDTGALTSFISGKYASQENFKRDPIKNPKNWIPANCSHLEINGQCSLNLNYYRF